MRIYVRGGGGGQGAPRVGGVGGDGGDVLVEAVEGGSLSVLARMEQRRFIAGSGEHWGRGRGRRGRDMVVSVPPGTVVYREDGAQVSEQCLALGLTPSECLGNLILH